MWLSSMSMDRILFTIISILIISYSCTKPSELTMALYLAGDNADELEKVLLHYSGNKNDSLKYKAAVFLIENMQGHYSVCGESLSKYYKALDSIQLSTEDYNQVKSFYDSAFEDKDIFHDLEKRRI